MVYTEEFINEVKEIYPNFMELVILCKKGSTSVGKILYDTAPKGFPVSNIMSATSLDMLKSEAEIYKRKIDLYHKWKCQIERIDIINSNN